MQAQMPSGTKRGEKKHHGNLVGDDILLFKAG